MQPRQKSHSLEEGGRTSNAKRKFTGKARLPGVKRKCKAVDPDKAQETAPNQGRAGPSTPTDLEDVVSSVAERMIPELNKAIETIISKRLDTSEGSHVSFNQSATCNNQHSVPNLSDSDDVVCFDAISPSCSSQSITSIHDDISMHVPQSVKQKIMNGEFIELHTLLNKQNDLEAQENKVLFMNGQFTLKPTNVIKITTIDAWLDAFFIFMSIYLSAHIDETHSLIKYIANVKLGASRVSGGLGWRDYDRQFRLRKAKDNSISWGKIDQELWLLYITPNVHSVLRNTQASPKFCYEYNNKGFCRLQNCQYQHQCLKCQNKHPAIHCFDKQSLQKFPNSKNFQASQSASSNFRQSGYRHQSNSFRGKNRFNSS